MHTQWLQLILIKKIKIKYVCTHHYTIGTWLGMQLEFELDNGGIILGKCKVDATNERNFIGNC